MPISGLVITTSPGAAHSDSSAAVTILRALPFLELGIVEGVHSAAVLSGDDYASHDAHLATLRALPEVLWVDVVFHDFSDVSEFERPARRDFERSPQRDRGSHGPA